MRLFTPHVLVLALLAACPAQEAPVRSPKAREATAELAYPVLRHVPARVTYALVAARVSDISKALAELVSAIGILADFDAGAANKWAHQSTGVRLFQVNDLASAGISLDRSVAIFSRELYPTLIIPVADEERMDELLESRRPARNVTVRRHRGYEVYAWRSDEDDSVGLHGPLEWVRTLSWVRVDDWLIVHLGGSRTAKDVTWLDDVLSVRPGHGLAGQADFTAALAAARRYLPEAKRASPVAAPVLLGEVGARTVRPGIVGLVRLERLRLLAALRSLSPRQLEPCWTPFQREGGLLTIGANTRWDGADGVVAVRLDTEAAETLRAAIADPPPPGYLAFREHSGLYLDWGLGLRWLRDLAHRSRCELVYPFDLPLLAKFVGDAADGYHLAGSDFRVKLSATVKQHGRAALHLSLREPGYAQRLLDQIPQRKALERSHRVNGVEVKLIRAPLFPEVTYLLGDSSLTVALGAGVMNVILAPTEADAAVGVEIGAMGIEPGRLLGLPESLAHLGAMVTGGSRSGLRYRARRIGVRLARYEYGRLRLAIDGKTLVLTAGMRLR